VSRLAGIHLKSLFISAVLLLCISVQPTASGNPSTADSLVEQCKKQKDIGIFQNDPTALNKALQFCNAAVAASPDYSEGYFWRGFLYTLLGDPAKGLAAFNKVLSIHPNDLQALGNRAAAYRAMGKYEEALADANKVILEDPKDVNAYMTKILVLAAQNDFDTALRVLDIAVQVEPKTAASWGLRCAIQFDFQRYSEAYHDCDKAIQLEPSYAHAYLVRGMTKMRLNDFAGAISDSSMAIKLAPQAVYYNNRAVIYMNMRKYEEALPDFAKATSLDQSLPEPYFGRGWIFAQQGKVNEAIEQYEKFFKFAPSNNPYRPAAEGSLKALRQFKQ
jgi:tetratricopeptide (TPR) repeat protein